MTVLSPPTDNLYKFLALSGIALVIACLLGPWRLEQDLNRARFELEAQLAVAQAEMTALDEDRGRVAVEVKSLESLVDSLRAARNVLTPAEVETYHKSISTLKDRNEVIRDRAREQPIAVARLGAKAHQLTRMLADLEWISWFSNVGFSVGLVLSCIGFWLWYFRVQVYLDRDLRAGKT